VEAARDGSPLSVNTSRNSFAPPIHRNDHSAETATRLRKDSPVSMLSSSAPEQLLRLSPSRHPPCAKPLPEPLLGAKSAKSELLPYVWGSTCCPIFPRRGIERMVGFSFSEPRVSHCCDRPTKWGWRSNPPLCRVLDCFVLALPRQAWWRYPVHRTICVAACQVRYMPTCSDLLLRNCSCKRRLCLSRCG
jgi:hypothetical protein